MSVLMAVWCQHQVVIVGRTFGARSIDWSLDRRRIGAIVRSVDRRRIGTIIRSVDRRCIGAISIVIAGIAALSVCRWYVAVRCQYGVGSVGRSARSLVIGLVRRHIGVVSCWFRFVCISAQGLSGYRVC